MQGTAIIVRIAYSVVTVTTQDAVLPPAVAVIVEHGGYGGVTAAPIARRIFDAWLVEPEPGEDPVGDSSDGGPSSEAAGQGVAADEGEADE